METEVTIALITGLISAVSAISVAIIKGNVDKKKFQEEQLNRDKEQQARESALVAEQILKTDRISSMQEELKSGLERLNYSTEATEQTIQHLNESFSAQLENLNEKFDTKIDNLDEKLNTMKSNFSDDLNDLSKNVEKHNNFAVRLPVLEQEMKVANHRIKDLEESNRKQGDWYSASLFFITLISPASCYMRNAEGLYLCLKAPQKAHCIYHTQYHQ